MEKVKLYKGDCLEIMQELPEGCVDLVLCDLPYGLTSASWDIVIPFDKLWEQYLRVGKENCIYVLFGNQPFTSDVVMSNRKMFRQELIWEKTRPLGFFDAKYIHLKTHENICLFSKTGIRKTTYNPQKETISVKPRRSSIKQNSKTELYGKTSNEKETLYFDDGSRYPKSVLKFAKTKSEDAHKHPTQKPIKLLEYLIKTFSNEGDVVLDNCMGSGSCGVACLRTDRNFIGIEKNENFYKIAEKWINEELSNKNITEENQEVFDLFC